MCYERNDSKFKRMDVQLLGVSFNKSEQDCRPWKALLLDGSVQRHIECLAGTAHIL